MLDACIQDTVQRRSTTVYGTDFASRIPRLSGVTREVDSTLLEVCFTRGLVHVKHVAVYGKGIL